MAAFAYIYFNNYVAPPTASVASVMSGALKLTPQQQVGGELPLAGLLCWCLGCRPVGLALWLWIGVPLEWPVAARCEAMPRVVGCRFGEVATGSAQSKAVCCSGVLVSVLGRVPQPCSYACSSACTHSLQAYNFVPARVPRFPHTV
jgi:hypothetical protein